MNIKDFFKSRLFKLILIGIGGLAVFLLIFQLGVVVGYKKAGFSYRFGDNYHRIFGEPQKRGGFPRGFMPPPDFIAGHGVAGTVVKVEDENVIIKGFDEIEKIISIESGTTTIRRGRMDLKITDLKVDDRITVIGSPKDDGSIDAKIIRVF